jgi:hypothetical protein
MFSSAVFAGAFPKEKWHRESTRFGTDGVRFLSSPSTNGRQGREANRPWQDAIEQIIELGQLADDWDGLGAKAPAHEVVESVLGLALVLADLGVPAPQRVTPGLNGEVDFEWQQPDGLFVHIENDRPFHAEVMVIEPGKPATFFTLPTD